MTKKILVIEDDLPILQMFGSVLTEAGYKVETAENGSIGLDKVREFKPNLIILDIKMPVMDGYGVLKSLEPDEDGKIIPVIVLTSLVGENDEKLAKSLGATDFINKSDIHVDDILVMVKKHL